MATQFEIDYAIMAGRAYQTNRSGENWFSVPDGWTEFFHVPNDNYPTSSGFEAVSFQSGNQIVISFAGTDSKNITGDIAADIGLAMGWGSKQLLQAAEYYMQVKAANPNATISFTGHSLGGGLAALMGVFFNKTAVTFDQAPFAASLKMSIRDDILYYLVETANYSIEDITTLAPGLINCTAADLSTRQSNVSGQYVYGEFLSHWPILCRYSVIGNQQMLTHGSPDISGTDLHSQSLLTAFLANDDFRLASYQLTDLIGMLFDKRLYYNETYKDKENFLERLVRHEFGNAPGVAQADLMLTRFTNDLQKIAQDGGLTMSNSKLTDALTAFAMQMYYANPAASGSDKELFEQLTGGIHFNRVDVAASLDDAKGYNLYFNKYLRTLLGNGTGIITQQIPNLLDWYIQAGTDAMVAVGGTQKAFMLGWNSGDTLIGSTDSDLLYGGAEADTLSGGTGADTLIGGIGNDVLNGGLGHDVYYYEAGDGDDQIIEWRNAA